MHNLLLCQLFGIIEDLQLPTFLATDHQSWYDIQIGLILQDSFLSILPSHMNGFNIPYPQYLINIQCTALSSTHLLHTGHWCLGFILLLHIQFSLEMQGYLFVLQGQVGFRIPVLILSLWRQLNWGGGIPLGVMEETLLTTDQEGQVGLVRWLWTLKLSMVAFSTCNWSLLCAVLLHHAVVLIVSVINLHATPVNTSAST